MEDQNDDDLKKLTATQRCLLDSEPIDVTHRMEHGSIGRFEAEAFDSRRDSQTAS